MKSEKHDSGVVLEVPVKAVDVYDAYNKNWIGADTCGTLTANSMTSTTHAGTFEPALGIPLGVLRNVRSDYGKQIRLDTSCNQGIFVKVSEDLTVYAVWYPKKQCYVAIRKLTPKECFRLQGWSDDDFEKAQFVSSDSQLYKQAGNGVTVNVIYEIAKKLKKDDKQ